MIPRKYDVETDVIVVGYGAAGAAAAITAHDNGASVIILDKMSIPGGNSRVSVANMAIPEDSEKFAQYLKTITFATTEPEIIDTFAEGVMELKDWIATMGGELMRFNWPEASYSYNSPDVTFPSLLGGEDIKRWHVKQTETTPEPTGGDRLWHLLAKQVESRGIKVMLSTPATALIQDQKGEIVGVIAESERKSISIGARRGVVLTCGGFENNETLKRDSLSPKPMLFLGNPSNTGDGIRMVQKVGAALWHMGTTACNIGFKAPEYEAAFFVNFLAPGFIYVDKYGKRFVDEGSIDSHAYGISLSEFDTKRCEYRHVPFYVIFDEEIRRRSPISWATCGYSKVIEKYNWSPDNSAEVKKGWIIRARTIAELAKRISADESTLENTIAKYNEYCRVGKDADFGRPKDRLKAIEGPPYYAMQLWPALLNTQGGPRRDKEARVLDPDDNPIPRLFAAGEFGSIWGFLYQTATNMDEALVFGQIAGRNAAMNRPVEP